MKTRLYAIIGLLGLLPVLAVGFGLVAITTVERDNAALDRAATGAINLERLNGLVYAAVMDSRGLYLASDWPAAAFYAQSLTHTLAELQTSAVPSGADASEVERLTAEELGRSISPFIRFRVELMRIAREQGIEAARAFGENDASRRAQATLSDSLTSVAQRYERAIGAAESNIARDQQLFMEALAVLVVAAVATLCVGIVLVRRSLLAPLLRVRSAMLRLAAGDLRSDQHEGSRDAVEISEMVHAVSVFHDNLIDRQKLNHESRMLSELNEWLQSCNSLNELYGMVAQFLAKLLPTCSGILYTYSNSRDVLESAKAWNSADITVAMHPADCWGLRRGRTYTYGGNAIDFPCAHVTAADPGAYCCIPILAHGETIGLLHLSFADDMEEQRRLGLICAEQISLAIANVKLRDQLRDQSIRDVLTGLYNRRYMLETCRREFSRAGRARQPVSILSIDVDHFKKYNDNHGHDAGDIVLRAIGECLTSTFRNEDVPCRFGGEEFVAILPGATVENAVRRAEELRGKVESLVVRYLDGNLPRITISVGVAAYPEAGDNPEAVLKAADQALYRAKDNGRNRVEAVTAAEPAAAAARTPPEPHPGVDTAPRLAAVADD